MATKYAIRRTGADGDFEYFIGFLHLGRQSISKWSATQIKFSKYEDVMKIVFQQIQDSWLKSETEQIKRSLKIIPLEFPDV